MKFFYIISIALSSLIFSNQASITMPPINLAEILLEDQNRDSNSPMRYAFDFDVDINLFDNASVEYLSNGDKVWRLRIDSGEAIGMKLYFNEFYFKF